MNPGIGSQSASLASWPATNTDNHIIAQTLNSTYFTLAHRWSPADPAGVQMQQTPNTKEDRGEQQHSAS